jgi:hypothetical protein
VNESGSEASEAADRPENSSDGVLPIKEPSVQMWFRKWAASGNCSGAVGVVRSGTARTGDYGPCVLPARLGTTCPGGRQTHPAGIRVPGSHLPTCNLFPSKAQLCCRDLTRQTQRLQPPFPFSQSHSLSTPRLDHIPLLTTIPLGDHRCRFQSPLSALSRESTMSLLAPISRQT